MLCAAAYAGWDYHRISQIYLPPKQRSTAYMDDPWEHARKSRLFATTVRFAEVTSEPVTRESAAWLLPQALQTLHFSPESRVIIQVIESASLLGRGDLVRAHLLRFRAAFPREHQAWAQGNRQMLDAARALQAGSAASP
jgi:hypothetical protein